MYNYILDRIASIRQDVVYTGLKNKPSNPVGTRMMRAAFQLLVDFVECECAEICVADSTVMRNKYGVPWWYRIGNIQLRRWRCAEAGLDWLRQQLSLSTIYPDDHRTLSEIIALYEWWTEDRDVFIFSTNQDAANRLITQDVADELIHQSDQDHFIRLVIIREDITA